jgi:ankyrin repeat protein
MKDSPDLIIGADQLCRAAADGQLRVAAFLLDHGANINDGKKENMDLDLSRGDTPLVTAVKRNRQSMIEFLLDRGADANLDAGNDSALFVAAQKGYETCAEILLAHKADINVPHRDSKETPLFVACEKGFTNLVNLFLTHGADVNAANNYGSTPLLKVVQDGQLPLARMLLSATRYYSKLCPIPISLKLFLTRVRKLIRLSTTRGRRHYARLLARTMPIRWASC